MRPLRIVHTESSLGWGGQEIRILTEARGCLDRGHHVLLLTPSESEIFTAAGKAGIPVEALPIATKRLGPLLAMRRWLAARAHAFDVINTHSSTDSWLSALALASLGRPLPLVRTRHVSTPIHTGASTNWLYRRATAHIVTTGEALRQQLHRDNGFPLDHMTSVRTGIDLTRFSPRNRTAAREQLGLGGGPVVGILATLRDWKGHRHLLEAFALLRARFPEWRLLVVGDGPERERLGARVAELGIAEHVILAGNQDDVPAWLCAMDLFVLPSYGNEGVPQGIMQAMACALPVIATPVGAVREAVVEGVTGLIVEPRDPPRLAEAMAQLMSDASRREALGAAGLAHARNEFGADIMVERMLGVFRAAIAAHRTGAAR